MACCLRSPLLVLLPDKLLAPRGLLPANAHALSNECLIDVEHLDIKDQIGIRGW